MCVCVCVCVRAQAQARTVSKSKIPRGYLTYSILVYDAFTHC